MGDTRIVSKGSGVVSYKVVFKSQEVEVVENVIEVIYGEKQIRMFDIQDNLLFLADSDSIYYLKKEESE